MKSLVLLPFAAILLTSCTSVFNAVHVKYNGRTWKFKSTVGYELRTEGSDIQVRDNALGAGPGSSASAGGGDRSGRTLADRWREEELSTGGSSGE